ncbi:MAG: type II CRISPR RNA-guided endonuclease Cas9, partial [Thermoguttaceae bacterium]
VAGADEEKAELQEVVDFLPPLCKDKGCVLTNPVVTRALTELRKVVNAIIREYGKPERIVVELARDLKRSRKERESLSKKMREQETLREKARKKIIEEINIQEPSRTDILKYMLAEECKWECPYTGKMITPESLLGQPQFDIEHILPFSRSLDNSFINKTLCYHEENRNVKKNQTPFEAYHGTERWDEIMVRIKKLPRPKQERFLMEQIPDDFSSRMLNDTRYISRQATTYLAKLYGGQIELSDENDKMGKRRIFTCNGQATAWLRDEWGLNGILNKEEDRKNRSDHRHHAIDALVVAFCNQTIVEQLSRAAEASEQYGNHRLFNHDKIEQPRPNFLKVVRKAVDEINVSYRSNRKVSGALHDATNYSKPYLELNKYGKLQEFRHKRISLSKLTKDNIQRIVDGGIRRIIEQKLAEIGDIKKFANPENIPFREVITKEGEKRRIPIKQVRIKDANTTITIGHGPTQRFVVPGNNHHVEIVATLDTKGNEIRWTGHVVTLFDAVQRKKQGKPVIQRDHGPGKRFKFSLAINEYMLLDKPDSNPQLYRVISLEKDGRINMKLHTDASASPSKDNSKTKEERNAARNASRFNINKDLRGKSQKVKVDYLGGIHPAND